MSSALVPVAPAKLAETSSSAVAAQAKAQVEARYLMAMNKPRDVMQFRARLLAECERPGFAATVEYALPRGGKTITGESIRFVETALRLYTNILSETMVVFDDEDRLIQRITLTDLETNTTYYQDVVMRKALERRDAKGQEVISSRMNSTNQVVHLVRVQDDELAMKVNALSSKAIRTNGLRLLPADIVAEAVAVARETVKRKDAEDPQAALLNIADAFEREGVMPAQLAEFLGHPLADKVTADELAMLRTAYVAVKDRLASWSEIMEQTRPADDDKVSASEARLRGVSALNEKLKAKKAGAKKAPAAEPTPEIEGQDDRDLAD
jgi:hypothetical protein